MRNKSTLAIFTAMGLSLLFVSQALAQAPIEGWDKAKFGMSPEELKDAYKEEQEYYKDLYYEQVDHIEKCYAHDPEKLRKQKAELGEYKGFWQEKEECAFGLPRPHTLRPRWLEVLGIYPAKESSPIFPNALSPVTFRFVDNKLFHIKIESNLSLPVYLPNLLKKEKHTKQAKEQLQKIRELKDYLGKKYGQSTKEEEVEQEEYEYHEKIRDGILKKQTFTWKDKSGHILEMKRWIEQFRYKGEEEYNGVCLWFEINYFDSQLKELWEKKVDEWIEKWVEQLKKTEKLREKGIESF